ncbi:MAG: hypothetical protein AAF518_16065 [Spirochaetota bacterium]
MNFKKSTIILLCLIFPSFLFADIIRLKNGRVFYGTVKKQSSDLVTIKLNKKVNGKDTVRIWKKDIISLVYVDPKKSKRRRRKRRTSRRTNSTRNKTRQKSQASLRNQNNSTAARTSDRYEKVTEKITVDKELTNDVMEKFSEADKRREKATLAEIDVLKEELEYLKAERERLKRSDDENDKFRKMMDKRMSGLEIRIRRLEKYLGMDESMVEYYQRKRSPWDIVKRSAIFPGWGHRYAREEYTGNTYSTLFISFLVFGYFIDYQANVGKQTVQNAFETKIVSQALQLEAVGFTGSLSNSVLYSTYGNYTNGIDTVNTQKQLASNFFTAAAVLYGIQLVHAYFTGVEWAKSKPRDYSNEELMRPVGWDMNIRPQNNPYSDKKTGTEYALSYTMRY